ncbi:MAG: hypothetical protein J6L85_03860 [Clostridia bacterium]|nr:hypothetical protein [Clostridia bacterium]
MKLLGNSVPSGKRTAIFSVTALCLAALSMLGRLICLLFFYDQIGYFKVGAALPVIFNLLYALSIVFFALSSVFFKPIAPENKLSEITKLSALLPCAAFVPYIITGISDILKVAPGEKAPLFDILSLIFAVISAVYFASLAFFKQPNSTSATLGVGCILWFVLTWMSSYLDFFVPMNSPDKLFFHFACIGAILIVLADVCLSANLPRAKAYYFSFFTGLLTVATSAIPNIVANAKNIFASYSLFHEDVVFTAILIYGTVRLCSQVWGKRKEVESDNISDSEDSKV